MLDIEILIALNKALQYLLYTISQMFTSKSCAFRSTIDISNWFWDSPKKAHFESCKMVVQREMDRIFLQTQTVKLFLKNEKIQNNNILLWLQLPSYSLSVDDWIVVNFKPSYCLSNLKKNYTRLKLFNSTKNYTNNFISNSDCIVFRKRLAKNYNWASGIWMKW